MAAKPASKLRLGEGVDPQCRYCAHCAPTLDDTCFCARRGVVEPDFHCRRFEYTPLKRVPNPPVKLPDDYSKEDFSI